jgi:hydrogenase maturation protease
MTAGSVDGVAPVLVLALGNVLLRDDGVGQQILERLASTTGLGGIEYLDGGTQGLALLGRLAGRRSLLILDAVGLGAAPGAVHVLRGAEVTAPATSRTAHEGNAAELLNAARLTGDWIEDTVVVGIEPEVVSTGIGLSSQVEAAVAEASSVAARVLARMTSG